MTDCFDWVWETKDGKIVAIHVEYNDDWFSRFPRTPAARKADEKKNKRDIAKFCSDAIKANCIPKRLPHDEATRRLKESL